jgi:cytidine deaminase
MTNRLYVPSELQATKAFDPWRTFVEFAPMAMEKTREWRDQANHYDGFNVGAVALAMTHAGDIALFGAANQNLEPGSNPSKMCAERIALQKIVHHKFSRMIAMFTSGPQQPDTQSKLATPTLHTCGECRDAQVDTDVVPFDALMVTVDPAEDRYEIYTFGEYLDMHVGGKVPRGFNHYQDPGLAVARTGVDRYDVMLAHSKPCADLAHLALVGHL